MKNALVSLCCQLATADWSLVVGAVDAVLRSYEAA